MDKSNSIRKLLEISDKFDIKKYECEDLSQTHSGFEGTPRKHPYDKSRVLIVTNPFDESQLFYEFPIKSIDFIEDIETITSEDGRSAPILRFWIKKGTMGIKSEPFIV